MLALLVCALVAAELGFGGEDPADTPVEREKAAMRQRLAEDRVRSQFLRREEASILGGLAELDRRIEGERARALELHARKQRLALGRLAAEAEAGRARARLDDERRRVGRRAAAMHRLRRTQLGDLLARTRGPGELRRVGDWLQRVIAYDAELVAATRRAESDARAAFAAFEAESAALEAAERELELAREELLTARADRAALLDAIGKERQVIERVAGEIAAAARKLDLELDVVRGVEPAPAPVAGGFGAQRGRLPWPSVGRVEVPFGMRVDPDTGVVMNQKGVDLRAKITEPVRSVFAGKVAFVGALEGYGRTVILDHGEGYFTVSAHLESAAIAAGSSVEQGQVIGYVGDSGSLKGPYLYFEIRQGKTAVDPLAWLAK